MAKDDGFQLMLLPPRRDDIVLPNDVIERVLDEVAALVLQVLGTQAAEGSEVNDDSRS